MKYLLIAMNEITHIYKAIRMHPSFSICNESREVSGPGMATVSTHLKFLS
jgi:hypothetical protein